MNGPELIDRRRWDIEYDTGRWSYLAGESEAPRYRLMSDRIRARGGAPAVLDLGCGEALLYRWLGGPGFTGRYLGVDWSMSALPRGPWPPGHGVVCGDVGRPPVGGRFEVVVCGEVLYYLSEPEAAVAAFAELTAPGGEVLISLFQPDPDRHPDYHRHIRRLDRMLTGEAGAIRLPPVCGDAGPRVRTWFIYTIGKELP